MAKLGELTSPVMRSTASLQRYRATRLRCEETKQLSTADPLAKYPSTPLIRSVNWRARFLAPRKEISEAF
jgi:hypothetical protein